MQGPSADDNRQTFIDAVLTQNNGESNALSRAAWTKEPETGLSLLAIVLNSLTEAGCFTGVENKQKVIDAICKPDKKGVNALHNALQSSHYIYEKRQESCPNIKILLDTLAKANCFDGPSSESNKETFIQAVLASGEGNSSVLGRAMSNPDTLQQILTALNEAGCFTSATGRQSFINALIRPDILGQIPLSHCLQCNSLKLIYKQLKETDCFSDIENKKKIIDAIFSQDEDNNNALSAPFRDKKSLAVILRLLTEAGCFSDPANQQAFVRAVMAPNKYGWTYLFKSILSKKILNQLIKIKYFEGPFAGQNKQDFIKAVLTPIRVLIN